ncbi:MAG: polyphosphate kinase 1 [Treponema sp.]|nr:polyphosphate kinase 1 [Treponema sp.]
MDANSGYGNNVSSPFFNRELSWLDFNERVLEEGLKKSLPPLERFKFLSIVSSNFDEFFMVRVAAIKQARKSGEGKDAPAGEGRLPAPAGGGFSPVEILEKISRKVRSIKKRQSEAFVNEVFPSLAQGGLRLLRPEDWTDDQKEYLESLFSREIYPLLTPLRVEEEGPLPSIENYSVYVAFLLEAESVQSWASKADSPQLEHISIVRIPPALERIVWLPGESTLSAGAGRWVLLEDLVQVHGGSLYPGYKVKEHLVFKINRDADFSVDEKRDEDFIVAMGEVLEGREHSMPVRMVHTPGSVKVRDYLACRLSLEEDDIFEVAFPVNPGKLYELILSRGFDHLREKPWKIYPHPVLHEDQPLWDRIRAGDIVLHLPYQSFDPVVRFFQEAAGDPQVAAIKTTLYRTSGDSPVVRALEQASLAGKHVTAVVELKARFDEGRNISWANRLEKAGVIVVYGLAHLKIHAKATIVMRREYDRIKRYVHLSTGNYNERTAKYYEDIALFSAREDIAYDAGLLFNMITGYSAVQSMGKLVIAPTSLKRRILDLIARESSRSSPEAPGKIMAKMNALADPEIIWALYRASQMGVNVFLNIRGICMLTPGVKGLSENIRVVSVIDHYLEHSRIYYFANSGAEELYLASADWMSRNLERRVELMFPVLQEDTRKAVFETLSAYFRDNCQAWLLGSQGNWTRLAPAAGEEPFRAQAYFHARAAKAQAEEHPDPARGEFIVRRSTPLDAHE